MAKFKVIGRNAVAGVAPGRTVDLDLPEANVAALLAAGSIQRVAPPPREPTTPDPGVPEKARKAGG